MFDAGVLRLRAMNEGFSSGGDGSGASSRVVILRFSIQKNELLSQFLFFFPTSPEAMCQKGFWSNKLLLLYIFSHFPEGEISAVYMLRMHFPGFWYLWMWTVWLPTCLLVDRENIYSEKHICWQKQGLCDPRVYEQFIPLILWACSDQCSSKSWV